MKTDVIVYGVKKFFLLALGLITLNAGAETAPASQYDFGTKLSVIDIGYGVLATPMSVLGEVMRRDRILMRAAEQQKIEFRFHPFEKGVDSLPPLLVGQLDGAMPTDVVALEAIGNSDLILLGYVRQSFSTVVGPRGATIADLKGKRIGNAKGTSGHSTLLQGLAGAGLSESDVTLVQMNVRDMTEALTTGKIDAFAAWEPTPSTVLRTYPNRFSSLHKQISPAYLVVSRKLGQDNPEAVRLLAASLHRAVRWMQKSRSNLTTASAWTIEAMFRFTKVRQEITEKEIAALTRADLLDIAGAPLIPANESENNSGLWRTFQFFKKSGKLPADLSWQKVQSSFDREHTPAVIANAKRYKLDEFDYEH